MRFVVLGAGAVGGVLGARLHQGGHRVTLVARGAHYEAIRGRGLTLEEPDRRTVLAIDATDSPARIDWAGDEVVLLTTKSQGTAGALQALRAVAPPATPIVCVQNGVDNERQALRMFPNVYGAVVMVPAAHLEAGVVEAQATKLTGIVDVGRYPAGADARPEAITEALRAARFSSRVSDDVMRLKYAKLILNLGNAVDAVLADGADVERLAAAAEEEGKTALRAAGIDYEAQDVSDVSARWERMGVRRDLRQGSSTWQSLQRATGAVETDYLNGEIVLLGRLHGVATPINEALCRLADRAAREGRGPRALSARDVQREISEEAAAWTR